MFIYKGGENFLSPFKLDSLIMKPIDCFKKKHANRYKKIHE